MALPTLNPPACQGPAKMEPGPLHPPGVGSLGEPTSFCSHPEKVGGTEQTQGKGD